MAMPLNVSLLIVEDDPAVARAFGRVFHRRMCVHVAAGAADAICALEAREYDVILCDLLLLDGSGPDVQHWIRVNRPELLTRLVFITGSWPGVELVDTLRGHLTVLKPVDVDDLRRIVGSLAHRASVVRQRTMTPTPARA
ncbi:MAG: response regulator [Deltaproteobacteria bacterium]|jgi:DNA-binding NtrC family response regulator